MKKKVLLFVGVLSLMGIVVAYFLRAPAGSAPPKGRDLPEQVNANQTMTNADNNVSQAGQKEAQTPKPSRTELVAFAVNQANQPISFYGRVVDQDDTPVPGVTIRLRYAQAVALGTMTSETSKLVELATDGEGRFQLTGVRAERISIESMGKIGYKLSPQAILTPATTSDPANPVLYRMWKRQGADRLVIQDQDIRIRYDGSPQLLDLIEGKLATEPPADLRLSLLRTPLERKFGRREKYDWTARVEVLDGGLIESGDEFMFMAPETDYVQALELKQQANDPEWTPNKKVNFYLRSRGKYGRVTLEFRTGSDQPTTGLTFRSAINPTGSRNLEYDERQSVSTDSKFPPQ